MMMTKVAELAALQLNEFIAARTTAVKTLITPVVNLAGYEAKGDGTSDDTAAVQAAVDAAIAAGAKTVFAPPGRYKVTSLTNDAQIIFVGDSASFVGGYTGHINQLGDNGGLVQVSDHGAKGDGTTDDTAAVQAAVDAAREGATIQFKPGRTYFLTSVTITKQLTIDLNGAILTVDPTTSGANGSPAFWFKGSLGTTYPLTTCTQGATTVQTATPADSNNFQAGDYVVIADTKLVPAWNGGVEYGATGYVGRQEITTVLSAASGIITLAKAIEWGYDTSPTIAKVSPLHSPVVKNGAYITEVDPGTNYAGVLTGAAPHIFHFQLCIEPRVENCRFDKWQLHCVNFDKCVQPLVSGCTATDPFRPSLGGHAYFTRIQNCMGGEASGNHGRSVRHLVDFNQTYDGTSRANISLNCVIVSYYCHGLGAKRCTSSDDVHVGAGDGWVAGNPAFGADYDFTVINPRYTGSGVGVSLKTLSVGMKVISPEIRSTLRGIALTTGASGLDVIGGYVEAGVGSVLTRSKEGAADTFGIAPGDLSITGTTFRGASFLSIELAGELVLRHNRISVEKGNPFAAIFVQNVAPKSIDIEGNVVTMTSPGVFQSGIRTNVQPTDQYRVFANYIGGGYTASGLLLTAGNNLVARNNHVVAGAGGSSQLSFSGDINAARAGGAYLFGNSPNTYDHLPILAVDGGVNTNALAVLGAAGTHRVINFETGTMDNPSAAAVRWIVRANATAETGANAGTDFEISARDDSGLFLTQVMFLERSTGDAVMNAGRFRVAGTFQKPFIMGAYNLWVDATGKLRINNGTPASDTAGVVVGTQV